MYVTLVNMKWRFVVLVLFDVSGHIQHAALIDTPLSNCYTVFGVSGHVRDAGGHPAK